MYRRLAAFLSLALAGVRPFALPALPVVKTQAGLVSPRLETSRSGRPFFAFRGVPYAEPPLGPLRLSDPQPIGPWYDIKASADRESTCTQYNIFVVDEAKRVYGQEDCLYLSVFTPKVGRGDLPVMVWIHGGGFSAGAGHLHGPDYLMEKDIVLVLINYRLGALGFFSTEDGVIPGNFGLKDQSLALKWVKANIHNFGGDPELITLFGQSAGAASVHYHMMSPMSRGLFKRGIAQSGSAHAPWALIAPGTSKRRAQTSASLLRCPSQSSEAILSCLRNRTAQEIMALQEKFIEWTTDPPVVFGPVVERVSAGSFISFDPFLISTETPLLMGINSAEGAIKTAAISAMPIDAIGSLNSNFETIAPITLMYRDTSKNPNRITDRTRKYYFKDGPITSGSKENITNMYTDCWFLFGTSQALERHIGPAFLYYFDHLGSSSMVDAYSPTRISEGATHSDDLFYLFNMTAQFPAHKMSPTDWIVSERMVTMWTNFARFGHPTPVSSKSYWETVEPLNSYLHITSSGQTTERDLLTERANFWRDLDLRDAIGSQIDFLHL